MNTASSLSNVRHLPTNVALASSPSLNTRLNSLQTGNGKSAQDVHDAFTKFVGQTFYGQMMKAMRSTQGEPTYFHGGQAEKVFQGQLDQAMVEHMAEASADRFVEPLFARQFPRQAAELSRREASAQSADLGQLDQLRRR